MSGTVKVLPPDPSLPKTNPYFVQAQALAAAGDFQGLVQLDDYLGVGGYAPEGQVRTFIRREYERLTAATRSDA